MSYQFIDIITAVKEEGRVDRSNDLDNMIKRIINEVMIKHTRNKEYHELYVPSYNLAISSAGQSQFTLPGDFGKIKEVTFAVASGQSSRYLRQRNTFDLPYTTGAPVWWYIAGSILYIYPFSSIINTNVLTLGYSRVPTPLSGDSDVLAVDSLYPIIITETLSRIRRFHDDTQGDQAYKADSMQDMPSAEEKQ